MTVVYLKDGPRQAPAPRRHRWLGLARLFRSPPRSLQRRLRALRIFFFAAYARDDLSKVKPILDAASNDGHVFWIDHLDLGPGDIWSADIVAAIRASRALLVFCSTRSFASRDVYREVAAASRMNKAILPIFLEDVRAPDEFLYYLSVHQAIRISEPDWRDRLFCALEAMEKGQRRWASKGDPRSKCPPPLVPTQAR
jgi:hypothetical protein